jgi:putative SOS response-associated peptidase YedK
LDPHTSLDELANLMLPGPPGRFELREVSRRVNNVRHDDEECIAPAETQVNLFGTDQF